MKVDQQFPVSGWGVGGSNGNRLRKNSDSGNSVRRDQEDLSPKDSVQGSKEDRVIIGTKVDPSGTDAGLTMERARELADETANALASDPQAAMTAQANMNYYSVSCLLE